MDYNNNNVYNVSEDDVRDVEEVVESPEKTQEEDFEKWNKAKSNLDIKGIVFSVASVVLGFYCFFSCFMWEYSLLLSAVAGIAAIIFGVKYLVGGYHNQVFSKVTVAGFVLTILGFLLGFVRIILAFVAGFGKIIFTVLF